MLTVALAPKLLRRPLFGVPSHAAASRVRTTTTESQTFEHENYGYYDLSIYISATS
jgi:hypothetical protein